jgi:flagellar M-ring protein FliF
MKLPQGGLKRISAAVLVDHTLRWEGVGPKARRILEPLPPERLKAIRDLVAGAIGFDAARGDQLILETLPFESTLSIEPPPAPEAPAPAQPAPSGGPAWIERLLAQRHGIIIVSSAAAVLLLLLAATFYIVRRKRKKKTVEIAAAIGPTAHAAGALTPPANPAEQAKQEYEAKLAEQNATRQRLEAEALQSLKLPVVTTKKSEVLTKHISEAVKKDPVAAAQILRTWLYEAGR